MKAAVARCMGAQLKASSSRRSMISCKTASGMLQKIMYTSEFTIFYVLIISLFFSCRKKFFVSFEEPYCQFGQMLCIVNQIN